MLSLFILELITDRDGGGRSLIKLTQPKPLKESHDTETFFELEMPLNYPAGDRIVATTYSARRVSCKSRCSFINGTGKYVEKLLKRYSETTRPRQSGGRTRSIVLELLTNPHLASDQLKTVIITVIATKTDLGILSCVQKFRRLENWQELCG